jgi:hypothetical protein
MSAQSKLRGYQDGKRDGSDDLPARNLIGMDADYKSGYHVGHREGRVSAIVHLASPKLSAIERQEQIRKVIDLVAKKRK